MDKNTRVFVDGTSAVRVAEGVVHLEFYNNAENGTRERCGEVVMSQQAFLHTYGAMQDLIRQLTEAGIIKRRSAAADETPAAGASASPNFQ